MKGCHAICFSSEKCQVATALGNNKDSHSPGWWLNFFCSISQWCPEKGMFKLSACLVSFSEFSFWGNWALMVSEKVTEIQVFWKKIKFYCFLRTRDFWVVFACGSWGWYFQLLLCRSLNVEISNQKLAHCVSLGHRAQTGCLKDDFVSCQCLAKEGDCLSRL